MSTALFANAPTVSIRLRAPALDGPSRNTTSTTRPAFSCTAETASALPAPAALRYCVAGVERDRERQGHEQQHGERRAREEVDRDEPDRRGGQRGEHPRRCRTNEDMVERCFLGHRDDDGRRDDIDEREAQRGGERGAPCDHVVRRRAAERLERDG